MKIKTVSIITSLTLALIAMVFVTLNLWSKAEQDAPYRQILSFFELKEKAVIESHQKIAAYLESGDALKLQAAEEHLNLLNQQLQTLPPRVTAQVQPPIEQLKEGLTVKYRGAGKLAANPMQLLMQNEREMAAAVDSLADYVRKGGTDEPAQALRYMTLIHKLNKNILQLGQKREYRFRMNEASRGDGATMVAPVLATVDELRTLPGLGVMAKQEVDEFAALMGLETDTQEQQTVDKGKELIDEIAFLAGRYPKEWDNTLDTFRLAEQSRMGIQALEETLISTINDQEDAILQGRDQVLAKIDLANNTLTGAILLMGLLIFFFQNTVIVRNLRQFEAAIRNLVDSGQINHLRVKNPKTEIGRVSTLLNAFFDHLRQQEEQKDEQLKIIGESLAHMQHQVEDIHGHILTTQREMSDFEDIVRRVDELTDSVGEATRLVQDSAVKTETSMQGSMQRAAGMLTVSEENTAAVEQLRSSAQSLVNDVQNVTGIVDVINQIAEKTNLLALNAAIEAARAGEQGRGFAVVADEVRNLSWQTRDSVTEIQELLEKLQGSTTGLNSTMDQIMQASQRQNEETRQLQDTSAEVREDSQRMAELAQESSRVVSEQVQSMSTMLERMARVRTDINETAASTDAIQQEVKEKARQIAGLLGLDAQAPQPAIQPAGRLQDAIAKPALSSAA